MNKLELNNSCDCIQKLIILGYLKEYECQFNDESELQSGQICIVTDKIVDNGGYDENGEYQTLYESTITYYPIEYCPICGKKIEYKKNDVQTLKLV